MSLILTISGLPGSGKSTVARIVSARLQMPIFNIGNMRRAYAIANNISLEELNQRALIEAHGTDSDRFVDTYLAHLPEKHPSFVVDANMGYHFLPKSVKIFLIVDRKVAAQRIMADHRKEERWKNVEEGVKQLEKRFMLDQARYKHLYNIDYAEPSQYDLVLDSTHKTQEEIADEILAYLQQHRLLKKPL